MNYAAYYKTGKKLLIPSDGVNTDTSLAFNGVFYELYDSDYWANTIHLLENFCSPYSPLKPTVGQLWYDNKAQLLKCYVDSTWVNLQERKVDISNYCLSQNDLLTGSLVIADPANDYSIAHRGYVEQHKFDPNFKQGEINYIIHDNKYAVMHTTIFPNTNEIKLPVTMVDKKYSIICTVNNYTANSSALCTIYNKTTNSFQITTKGTFDTIACIITGFTL